MLHRHAGIGGLLADHVYRRQRTAAEPVEELEEIILDESRLERRTRMGTLASPLIRQDLTGFLRMNQDVFA